MFVRKEFAWWKIGALPPLNWRLPQNRAGIHEIALTWEYNLFAQFFLKKHSTSMENQKLENRKWQDDRQHFLFITNTVPRSTLFVCEKKRYVFYVQQFQLPPRE